MSYDVVALVVGKPDERTIRQALQDVDPDLWLHRHEDTHVLQIRDGDERLLATLEPGRLVEEPGEVVRLLGPDVVAGLPERFWWVETRARPDEAGREVAHRFADGLASRLGGAVWTSGTADFGLWEEPEHPAVERTATRALVVAQDRPVVPFSSWISDVVATRGDKLLQVLTPSTARLTYGVRTYLTGPMGRWVVRDEEGGHYDGITGLPVHWDDGLGFRPEKEPVGLNWGAREPDAEPVQGFVEDMSESTGVQLVVDVSAIHRPEDPRRPGRIVEILAEHLAGPGPTAWGPHEPAVRTWDREQLTEFVRRREPRAVVLFFAGPLDVGHPFSGQLRVAWREQGVLERASVVIGFSGEDAVPFDALPSVVEALAREDLLDGLRVRRLAGRRDTTFEPRWTGTAVQVGFAIGPGRLAEIGRGYAQAGPIRGTVLGEGERQAVWYPVLGDAEAPLQDLALVERQTAHLAAAGRR
ncbi:DUF6177 family protein [Nocardiopsis sp. FIRDI 009]|uniref:DUF6177 family protein n=1 Tax=Nocardiopsis sp. FIRDI 009 TaxID=714197 RepID=UPI000E2724B8|nr:DUF6177 family protein [Nocardiopsis sp. FIRDI 009]